MRVLKVAPVLACAWFAGCTMGPDYKRPEVVVPDRYARAPLAAASAPAEASDAARLDTAWWTGFGDPKLDELIRTALDQNLELQVAALRVQKYLAVLGVAEAALWPKADYGASRSRDTLSQNRQVPLAIGTDPVDNNYEVAIRASWELDLWGRLRRANEAASAQLLAAEENRRALVLSIVAEIASNYVRLLTVDRQIQLIEARLASWNESLGLLKVKLDGGRISELPVLNAQLQIDDLEASLPQRRMEAEQLENALAILVGQPVGPLVRQASLDDLRLPPIPAGVPAQVLVQRPDIRRAEQQLIAANAAIGVAKAQYLPTISLTVHEGFASNELSKLSKLTSNFASFGISLLGPLFDAGRISSEVKGAEADQQAAAVGYVQAVQVAVREVEDSLVWHRRQRELRDARRRQLSGLTTKVEVTQARSDGGVAEPADVLQADRDLLEGRQAVAVTQRDEALALISVFKAMGGGWSVADHVPSAVQISKSDHE